MSGDRELSDEDQRRMREAVRDMFPTTPFMSLLGVRVERFEPDRVRLRIPADPRLTNDGTQFHGGVIASLLDSAGGLAAWSNHDFTRGTRAATVSIDVQYLSGASPGADLVCDATAVKRGRELIFVEMRCSDSTDRLVAHGLLTYRIV